jgi:hypothetical protein
MSAAVEPVCDLEASSLLILRHFYPPFFEVWFARRYGFPGSKSPMMIFKPNFYMSDQKHYYFREIIFFSGA